ncbi:DUF2213 domain-containing protein [Rhizorhabdus wittichii]|uniref:DUF2213 domain-containing protein n=1 Tax=Rhizorhabdus wittichii TaxID=160791 RepID=UPI001D01A55C|nr:DUF2213 domain-containing protein [Rhizorhabdus wittichii]
MQITLMDRAPIEKVRRLPDGRIAAVAKFARTGCQTYLGAELGRPDLTTVTVYRPEDEVFAQDAMASFAHKAITLDHPGEDVSATNWKRLAVGFTEGRVARDGGFVEIPLMLADAQAVSAYDQGRARELSAGYSCELVWGDGIAPDGTPFQATQRSIRGNHIALVPAGRAGSECRIGDAMTLLNDAAVAAEVARQRMIHDQKFAFMGNRAPAFDEAIAAITARSTTLSGQAADVRNMARDIRYSAASTPAQVADARAEMIAVMRQPAGSSATSAEDVRNLARAARY